MISAFYLEKFLEMEKKYPEIGESFIDKKGNNVWLYMRTMFNSHMNRWKLPDIPNNVLVKEKLEIRENLLGALARVQKGSCLIFSAMQLHTEKVNGKLYDPYLDPVAMELRRIGILPVKVLFDFTGEGNQDFVIPPLPLAWQRSEVTEYTFLKPLSIKGYAEYQAICREMDIACIPCQNILNYQQSVFSRTELWKKILTVLEPELVVLECYYNEMAMGLAMACRHLGIPCIEYQHGLQNWPHLPYNLPYIPPHGYDALPKWFFQWGERDVRRMEGYFSRQDFHRSVVAGKPAYVAWTRGLGRNLELEARLDAVIGERIPICVALPVGEKKQYRLLESAIRQAPPHWLWLLRGHPVNQQPLSSGRELAELFPDRTERNLSTEISLHSLLQRSKHLVTGYSSTVIEATSLHNMHASCIHEKAKFFLKENIEKGEACFENSIEGLLKSILRGVSEYPYTYTYESEISKNKNQMVAAFKYVRAYEKINAKSVNA